MKPFFSFHVSLKSTKRSVLCFSKNFLTNTTDLYIVYVVVVGINSSSFSSRLLSKVQYYQPGNAYIKNNIITRTLHVYIYYIYTITAELTLRSSIYNHSHIDA